VFSDINLNKFIHSAKLFYIFFPMKIKKILMKKMIWGFVVLRIGRKLMGDFLAHFELLFSLAFDSPKQIITIRKLQISK